MLIFLLMVSLLWVDLVIPKRKHNLYNSVNLDEKDDEERSPLTYGFAALLYNLKIPHRMCIGAIITNWWILDHCIDFPGYKYDRFKVGWANTNKQKVVVYKIAKSIHHNDYKTVNFNISTFDAKNLFAARNALCLHRPEKQIEFIPEITRAIKINDVELLPKKGKAVYFYNGTILKYNVPIVNETICNFHFKPYFLKTTRITVKNELFCVSPAKKISVGHCCNSQVLIVCDNILVGIMAWSTGCSEEYGIDPWVFTSIGHYISWIANNTDWKTLEDK